jgi:putative transposase
MDTQHVLCATDLTDSEWVVIEPLLPRESTIGRPPLHSLLTTMTATFYELRTGGAWRFLPLD